MQKPPEPIETDPWMLDPSITYLNHGSFGARTQPVYEAQVAFKRQLEWSPVDFLDRDRTRMLNDSRQIVASFLGADPEGFGFVDNATTGVGCVVQSLDLQQGDEILTTTHVYNGVRKLLEHRANQTGCSYRELDISLPLLDASTITQSIVNAVTPATKLLVVDHVSSITSIVFPIVDIVQQCRARGVLVLVDGAHASGMLDLEIESIGADWYVGNLHKWVCAPIGAGFVCTAKEHRASTHPMTVSHFLGMSYIEEFDWQGTRDISPWLTAGFAVQWGEKIGWEIIRGHNHALATWMQARLIAAWGVEPLTPLDGSLIGTMATIPMPEGFPVELAECMDLRDALYRKYKIEIPVLAFQGKGMVRISAQLYSRPAHVEKLIQVMQKK